MIVIRLSKLVFNDDDVILISRKIGDNIAEIIAGARLPARLFDFDAYVLNDDDELSEAVTGAKLIDRAKVDVGFAGSRLHLGREVGGAPTLIACALQNKAFVAFEARLLRKRAVVVQVGVLLNGAEVVEEPGFVQGFVFRKVGENFVGEQILGFEALQTLEEAHDTRNGVDLILLFCVELKVQSLKKGRS